MTHDIFLITEGEKTSGNTGREEVRLREHADFVLATDICDTVYTCLNLSIKGGGTRQSGRVQLFYPPVICMINKR